MLRIWGLAKKLFSWRVFKLEWAHPPVGVLKLDVLQGGSIKYYTDWSKEYMSDCFEVDPVRYWPRVNIITVYLVRLL